MDTFVFIVTMLGLGASVGIVSAALGIGGGVLMVPALLFLYPIMDTNTAKGTSMLIIALVALNNAFLMNRGHMRNPTRFIAVIAIGAVIGGFLGAWTTSLLSDTGATWVFIGLLFFAGARSFLLKEPHVNEEEVLKRTQISVLVGLAAGFVAGATGTGGGAIFVPFALWAGIVSNKRVVALSNAIMVVSATAGTISNLLSPKSVDMAWTYGLVNISLAPLVIIGAVAAAPIGRKINHHLSFERRRFVMGALLLVITMRLIYRTLA
ncbi:MAG: sulfite exporter TauE/SafE family protein [Candidatus Hydrogenedentota bacterium]